MEQPNSITENKITILENIISNIIENIPYLVLFWKAFIVKLKLKYFIFCIVNIIINTVLKNIIREKRPTQTMKYGEYQKYGMPSGHAQFLWFSLFYDFNWDIQHLIMFIMCVISSIQRIVTKLHSFNQVFIGGIIGTILGFYFQKL
jgi:membrane-associated phospholipid phosphatase